MRGLRRARVLGVGVQGTKPNPEKGEGVTSHPTPSGESLTKRSFMQTAWIVACDTGFGI